LLHVDQEMLSICKLKEKKLIIEALKQTRAGWFGNYQPEYDEAVLGGIPVEEGDDLFRVPKRHLS